MECIRETFLPKDDVFQVKWILNDASCGHSNTKHILLSRHIWRQGDPVNISQVTAISENKMPRLILQNGAVSIPLQGSHPSSQHPPLRFLGPSMTLRASPPAAVSESMWIRSTWTSRETYGSPHHFLLGLAHQWPEEEVESACLPSKGPFPPTRPQPRTL